MTSETVTLRRSKRGPSETYIVERLTNRREPVVGTRLKAEAVDDLLIDARMRGRVPKLTVNILSAK